LILAPFIHRIGVAGAAILGTAFGLALYYVNFYWFTELFPWFEGARNWVSMTYHGIFGFAVGVAYKQLQRPPMARAEQVMVEEEERLRRAA
ncbi:MAG: hypothetical protein HY682_01135, partial [Chloroflexi bacterium]|nr:hypothetical protein [Chloroflexota bacterium]